MSSSAITLVIKPKKIPATNVWLFFTHKIEILPFFLWNSNFKVYAQKLNDIFCHSIISVIWTSSSKMEILCCINQYLTTEIKNQQKARFINLKV